VSRRALPGTRLDALGMMRIANTSDADIRALVGAAREAGIDYFDHASVYGDTMHGCEARFGEAPGLTPSQRDESTLQAKGWDRHEKTGLRFSTRTLSLRSTGR